jgi:ssDNA-binding Zn-finger/Zn-ribbon topoisomerase 1
MRPPGTYGVHTRIASPRPRWRELAGSHIVRFKVCDRPHEVHALLSWFLKRLFPSEVLKVSAAPAAQPTRYIDEKRAKAIKQAALFAESHGTKGAPQCPRCGAEMTLELARRGEQVGARFWGCTEYPTCRATRKA